MPDFGWTSLAYLLFVLAVLTALVQLASLSTDPRPLASEPRDGVAAATPQTTDEEPREAPSTTPPAAALPTALPASVADRLEDMATDVPGAGSPYTRHTRAPVFQRPAPASPPASSAAGSAAGSAAPRPPAYSSGPVCGDLENFPSSSRVLFPLPKRYFYSYEDTWGAPRPQGGHEGTDLMAPAGTPEYAVTDGTIVPVAGANKNGWNSLGGYAVMVEAAYTVGPIKKGDLFYYAHLDRPSALKIGARVRAGQVVGYAGDTGQGPEVTRGLFPTHLHLGWYDATGSRSDVVSGAMNPYPLLEWIRANGGAVVGGSDARYCQAPQTGVPVSSAGGSRWPTPDSPGVRPDLDTGSDNPMPSPVIRKSRHRADHPVDPAKKAKPPVQRAPPAKQSGQDTIDRATAKKQQPPSRGTPEAKPAARKPPPHGAGSPHESPPSETAEGHDPPSDKQQAEAGEDKKEAAEVHDQGKKPEKERSWQDSQPPNEQTEQTEQSSPEDPPASETTEPQATGETDTESTVPELLLETTTETMIETTAETTSAE